MGKWLKNPGTGENPIPGVKAGEFEICFKTKRAIIAWWDSSQYDWKTSRYRTSIEEYRLLPDKEHVLSSN